MAELRVLNAAPRGYQEDVCGLLAGLHEQAKRGEIAAVVVGYIQINPGSENDIVSDAAGGSIDRVACAAMVFHNETADADTET